MMNRVNHTEEVNITIDKTSQSMKPQAASFAR